MFVYRSLIINWKGMKVDSDFPSLVPLRQGSVVVTFALSLRGVVGSTEAQKQLVRGLQSGGVNPGGLVVDPSSVMVSGKLQCWPYLSVPSHLNLVDLPKLGYFWFICSSLLVMAADPISVPFKN